MAFGGAGAAPNNLPTSFRCVNHPDREGVGICVSCRAVVCVECSTKIDRMNYCIRCLQAATEASARPRRDDPGRELALGIPMLLLALGMSFGVFLLLGIALATLRALNPGGVSAG